MPTERISMRSVRDVLRLRSAGLSLREIQVSIDALTLQLEDLEQEESGPAARPQG